jgi:molybdopterin-containing oxidoreductase family iron-sulfur binding subunit
MSKRKPYEIAKPAPGTPLQWTSLEDLEAQLSKDPELQARVEAKLAQEFPDGASEFTDPVSRRSFLQLMSAGIALATLEGCRRPVDKILPYTRAPENVNVGAAQHYATVMDRHGDALGLLVESHEGRPTKIEGNPDHPVSRGRADLLAQASVLDLYDPDRSRQPAQIEGARGAGEPRWVNKTYAEFDHAFAALMESHQGNGGAGLRVLAQPTTSPTFVRLRERVLARFPQARFHTWSAVGASNAREGARLAFGQPVNTVHAFERARVILALDADFLQTEPGMVRNTRGFAESRRMRAATDEMNRLYVVEPTMTTTGTNADHRLRLPARDIERYLLALAARLSANHGVALPELNSVLGNAQPPAGVPAHWIDVVAADLARARGTSVIIVGSGQPATVHALAHVLNAALGNVGTTVTYYPAVDPAEGDHAGDLRALAQAIEAGQVETLVILGGNPAYDAPGDLGLAAKLARVRNVVHVSSHRDETSALANWHVPLAHYLETWGDHRALDGTLGIQQPLIAPLYSGRSEIEILAAMVGEGPRAGYDLVRETMRPMAAAGFERTWRRALHMGFVDGNAAPAAVTPRGADVATQLAARQPGAAIGQNNLEVVFLTDAKMYDGRHANNAWLAELPDPVTRITWDNAAYFSPATARALGVASGDVVRISKGDRSIEIVAWILPGQADWSIGLPLGWGRARAGRVGTARGFDVNPLRSIESLRFLDGVQVAKVGRRYPISQTQEHHRMEGRPVALQATLAEYRAQPHFGEFRSITPRTLPLWREVEYNGHKWGMVIDLNACTGCNACAIACQAENNVPVVGKAEVARGREMHWLRVDRYFIGNESDPGAVYQPLMCVQCEEAPCENVCPVNATAHSPEGLNDMAYNRCIGTRYCSNNCPYKVRRFNYLNWHNDGVWQPQDPDVPETVRMQHNPNVTVRFRGVMEKCTYCVQRIQSGKIVAKREDRHLRDGEINTACAQTCPADAIVFGDLNDRNSRVAQLARTDRRYKLLGELGTQPRTTYLADIRNPNPEMPQDRNTTPEMHG